MTEHDGKRMSASIMGLSTTPAWTAYQAELEKSKGNKPMTKLQELKAAAADANTAANDAWDSAEVASAAANDAWDAYAAKLKKTKEQTK